MKALVLLAALVPSLWAAPETLLEPDDLPPFPAAQARPGQLTHSQQSARQTMGGLDLAAADGTEEERALTKEASELKARLDEAEKHAYQEDPLLLLSDLYTERAHDWVTERHSEEFNASLKFMSMAGPNNRKLSQVISLIDGLLFIELAGNEKFYPLFQSLHEGMKSLRQKFPNARRGLYDYQRNDKLIGYPAEANPPPVSSLPEYLARMKPRHAKLLAKLKELQTELEIPQTALKGMIYGELYRMLDGIAQMAVEVRTPEEVTKLREELRRSIIQLANLRHKNGTTAPKK